MIVFPSEVTHAQTLCALRFLGWEYEIAVFGDTGSCGGGLSQLLGPIVQSLVLHTDQNANFAVFFALQRYLHKWGGERLTKYSDEHLAYDFLFLHLYRTEPPAEFTHLEYTNRWQRECVEKAETYAAFVRKSFRRIGRGKKIDI